MDPLSAEPLDDLLSEAADPDSVAGQAGIRLGDADDVALRGIGVEAEQEVGRGEVEEAERVGLDDLGQVHQPAQVGPGRRRLDREDLVARL